MSPAKGGALLGALVGFCVSIHVGSPCPIIAGFIAGGLLGAYLEVKFKEDGESG